MFSSLGDFSSKSANRKVRKLLGRAYLHESRVSEALEVYLGILKDFPGEADVLIILGNLYRLAGSPGSAEKLYRCALEKNPVDRLAEKQVILARQESARQEVAARQDTRACNWEIEDPLSSEAIERLAGYLLKETAPARVEEIQSAADLLEHSMTDEPQAEHNGNGHRSEDVHHLMPALIALSIRQARVNGYPDLAEALQSLQINLARQIDDRWADDLLKDEAPVERGPDE